MRNKFSRCALIIILILFAPLVYIEIQGYITINAVFPVINAFSAKSKTALVTIFTTFNLLCAILTAVITALPCGYLARKQPKIIAILIIISIESIPASLFFQEEKVGNFIMLVSLGQFVMVVLSVFILAEIGNRIAAKERDKAVI